MAGLPRYKGITLKSKGIKKNHSNGINGNGNHIGRPKVSIDFEELDKLCYLQCTVQEMAWWFKCTEMTLRNRVKEELHTTFENYYLQKKSAGKIALRRNLLRMAEKNPACAIFLAKNWLGMSDQQHIEHSGEVKQEIKQEVKVIAPNTLREAIESLVAGGAVQVSAN